MLCNIRGLLLKMKIKFVQLESEAFSADIDFIQFLPAERRVYYSLILFLGSNDGECGFDAPALSRLCNCETCGDFETNLGENFKKVSDTQRRDYQQGGRLCQGSPLGLESRSGSCGRAQERIGVQRMNKSAFVERRLVPLTQSKSAILDADDYDQLARGQPQRGFYTISRRQETAKPT
jgi:hypothetical protein